MKKVLIFGSTGSIGKSALAVIGKANNEFRVIGLSANKDIVTLKRQVKEFRPAYLCVSDEARAKRISQELPRGTKLFSGQKGLLQL